MALIGGNLRDYVDNSGNVNISTYSGYSGGSNYNSSGSSSGSGYKSVNSNYKDNAKNTAPVSEYNPYANGVPQSIIDAQNELNLRSIPNQQYAQMVQDTIIKDNLGYLSDPNYKGTYSAVEASQAFDYLTRANNGASYSNWAAPKADDQLFTQIVPQWDAARNIRASATEQYNSPVPTMEDTIIQSVYNNPQLNAAQKEILQASKIQPGDWRTMSTVDQLKALAVPSSNLEDTGVINAPGWAKWFQNILPSFLAGGAGAAVGSLFGPVGTAVGFGVTAGLTYLQGVTKVEIPVINELLYGMDILSVWAEQGQGAIGASLKETWDRSMADGTTDLIELGKTMGEVLKDFPDLWEVGQLSYEVGADLGFDNIFNFGRNAVAGISDTLFGTNIGQVDTNTMSRANLGLGGLVSVNPETRGYDSLTNVYMPMYRTIRDEAVKQGMDYNDAKKYALETLSENLTKYMGTTGLVNDFGASSVFDPLNFIPGIEADVAEKIGTKYHDDALVTAARTAKEGASPIVDAFSTPLIQPIVEFITGKHETQGLDTILRVYAKELQQKVPVQDLTNFQRRIAGIDNNGLIKNFEHETNFIKRWIGATEEAKIYNMSENMVSILGSALFDTEMNPEIIPEMISEFIGISPITPDGPLGQYADTALLKTMQSTLSEFTPEDIRKISERVNNFRNLNTNRMAVDTVADKLHIKKGDLFDMLDDPDRSAELKQRIFKENISIIDPQSNITLTPEDVFNKIDVFSSSQIGRTQYSMDILKTEIMDNISRKSQDALLGRYDIKPDSWFTRLGEIQKDIQSITLLNYSPSYFVNNFLNNIVTRSVTGVGGFDNKSIRTMSEKRGLSYSRDNSTYKKTEGAINSKKTKNDLVGKLKDTWGKVSDKKKPLGKILKGINNIDIEGLETRSAFEIGANKYWDATWKPGQNIPVLPIEFQSLGITEEMNKIIYKTAMDSSTLSEFKKKLIGDVILPGMNSTLTDMIKKRYNETTGPLIRDLIDSNPWIKERVATLLESGNPEIIRTGFKAIMDQVTRDIDIKNIAQLETEFENLATRFSWEGVSAFIDSRIAIDEVYSDIWINQTKESANLFHRRVVEGLWDEEKFRPIYEENIKRQIGDYKMARKYDIQMTAAMIVGLGIEDDIAKNLLLAKMKQYDNQSKYIAEEHKLFMKYGDSSSPDYDWQYYSKAKLEMCQKVLEQKLEGAKQYDQIIVKYLRDNLAKSYTTMIDTYEENLNHINQKRAELNAKEIEWLKERLDDRDVIHKEMVEYDDHSIERYILKNDIMAKLEDAHRTLQEIEGGMDSKSKDKIKLTHEQTLALELIYREAEKTTNDSGEFLEHFLDKSDPKTIFEPADFSNTNVKESFVDYAKHTSDPVQLYNAQKAYANGDAVPLGSVDLRGTENTIGQVTKAPSSESNEIRNPGEPRKYTPIEESADNSKELNSFIKEVKNSSLSDEIKEAILVDLNNKRPIKSIYEYAKFYTEDIVIEKIESVLFKQYPSMPENVKRSIVEELVYESGLRERPKKYSEDDIQKNKKVKRIINNFNSDTKKEIRAATNKVFTVNEFFKKISKKFDDSIYDNESKKNVINAASNFDTNLIPNIDSGNKNIVYEYDTLQEKIGITESQIEKINGEIDNLNEEINILDSRRKHNLESDSEKVNAEKETKKQEIKRLNEQIQQLKKESEPYNKRISEIEDELKQYSSKNISAIYAELDSQNKKFNSYDDYKNWMKARGIILFGDDEIIPERYQSQKYLSNLKQALFDADKAKTDAENAEAALKKFRRDVQKWKGSIEADNAAQIATDDAIKKQDSKASQEALKRYEDRKKAFDKRAYEDALHDLIQNELDAKKAFGEKQKNLVEKLSKDEHYKQFIKGERKLDYPKLFRDIEADPRFAANEEYTARQYQSEKFLTDLEKAVNDTKKAKEAYEKAEAETKKIAKNSDDASQKYKKFKRINSFAEKAKELFTQNREKLINQLESDEYYKKYSGDDIDFDSILNDIQSDLKHISEPDTISNPNTYNSEYEALLTRREELYSELDALQGYRRYEERPTYNVALRQIESDDANIRNQIKHIKENINEINARLTDISHREDINLSSESNTINNTSQSEEALLQSKGETFEGINNTQSIVNKTISDIDTRLETNNKYKETSNPYEKFKISNEEIESYYKERIEKILDNKDISKEDKLRIKSNIEFTIKNGLDISENDAYDKIAKKYSDAAIELQKLSEEIIATRQHYKEITGISDSLKLDKNNLYNICVRAGYSLDLSNAFSEYVIKIADKWNDNHPGKDFFKDAPGMNYDVNFFEKMADPRNVYGVEGRKVKGEYNYWTHVINLFGNADDQTLLHEIGHGFQYTLSEAAARELAKYFGWTYEEYISYRDAYTKQDYSKLENAKKWQDGAEIFARGFTDYLAQGKAPTSGLTKIFTQFKSFLKNFYDIYKRITHKKEGPTKYKPETKGINNGKSLYVHANDVVNGTSLSKIFDMLIAEDPEMVESSAPKLTNTTPIMTIGDTLTNPNNTQTHTPIDNTSIPPINNVTQPVQPNIVNPESQPVVETTNIPVPETNGQPVIEQPVKNLAPNPMPEINIGTEYSPINPDFKPSDAKFSQVASVPFYYDNHFVKAGVYYEGNLIAYISSDMPEVLHVGGNTFPVIGIDINNPEALWVYVHDEPELITPGKPNNIGYSIYANGEHPMRFGTTPTTQPWGQAAWETSLPLREALGFWRDEALDATFKAMQNDNFFGKLTPEQQEAIYNWADGKLRSAYNYQRFASQRYGNTMVDLAMLNYNDRHGFDNLLTSIMPYQYWLTRSVMNWGARMIDKPSWFSTYARLEKLIEKNKRDFLPTRLEGMPGIPLPFLPEGLGQGLYYDPYNIQLPFKQFFDMTKYFDRNLHTIHKNTISFIEELYRQRQPYNGHIITKKEYDDAMLGKGDLYNRIFWEKRNSDETNTGLSGLVSSYFNPNVLVSSLWKAIEANSRNVKDISYSPMYKLGNTLRASARDTAIEGVFGILADALQMPDKTWRKMLNVESDPIGSAWTDYWTVKYLSNMLYTKEHSKNEITNAIAEGESNPLWQEARNRYSTSEAYKQPIGALLTEIIQSIAGNKKTSVGNLSGTALASLFGAKTYPGGEEDFRRMQQLYNDIKDNDGMRNAFSEEFPEYKVGFYANIDNREELLHKILVDNCWDAYNALPQSQKNAAYNGLGHQFQELFVNKETRATDKIDNETLIAWTQAMHGNVPNIANSTIKQPLQDAFNIQWYNDSLQGLLDRYNRDKQQRYPGIDTIEQGYFNTRLQDQYLALHPELKDYWNWKESVGMANPQLGSYLKNKTAQNQVNSGKYSNITEAVKAQVNKYTRTCLENHIKKGWTLPAAAEHQLKYAYANLGAEIPFEQWLREIRF